MPPKAQTTALEEAEYEDEAHEDFEKHIVLQCKLYNCLSARKLTLV